MKIKNKKNLTTKFKLKFNYFLKQIKKIQIFARNFKMLFLFFFCSFVCLFFLCISNNYTLLLIISTFNS